MPILLQRISAFGFKNVPVSPRFSLKHLMSAFKDHNGMGFESIIIIIISINIIIMI